jgi:hypothetical protein
MYTLTLPSTTLESALAQQDRIIGCVLSINSQDTAKVTKSWGSGDWVVEITTDNIERIVSDLADDGFID